MADISVTAADVGFTTTQPSVRSGTAGETLVEGMAVYLKAADGKYWKTVVTGVATSVAAGIVITPAIADEKVQIATKGDIECGAATKLGEIYVLGGDAAGGIAAVGDLAENDYTTVIGFGKTGTNVLEVAITNTSLLHAA